MRDKAAKNISGAYLISFHFDHPIHKDEEEIIISSFFHLDLFLELDLKKMEGRLIRDYNSFGRGEYGGETRRLIRTVGIAKVNKHNVTLKRAIQL
jgi:hypothetical protein